MRKLLMYGLSMRYIRNSGHPPQHANERGLDLNEHLTETHRDQDRETLLARIDVLERENVALRRTAQEAQRIFDGSCDFLQRFDLAGNFLYISAACRSVLGYEPDEMIGKASFEFLHPDDVEPTKKEQQVLLAGGPTSRIELRLRRKDGVYVWMECRPVLIRGPHGEPLEFVVTAREVTERKRMEDQLRASEERFRALLTGLHVGVVMQEPSGKNVLFNPHALTLLGVTEDQLLGRTSFDPRWGAVYEDGSPCPGEVHPISVALRTAKPVRDFVHGIDRPALGDRVWLLVSAAPQLDEHGVVTGAIATFTDITARKEAEDLVRSQARMLEEMSTPLVPIRDDIVAMPLIGTVDARRADLVLDTLLTGIAQRGARVAILDITGVSVVDSHVATTLVRAAQAARLLGAQVVLTGIRGSVAQTLVDLGVDLSGLVTRGTLQGGIDWAFSRRS
ncbi:PAS domain S-box protein [Polyangium mundeleinium]|uniref:PAS domain S-box protein n=1 Tax=Polyangium mundeleinium TaxID=2995306 RepID=A0ABT5EGU8_9BACT|nr:PAS domain S-box protein [Polyangium mundeleinium]MDC0740587.1 PAS domain S-box protein [Polyangium mundeleinium]